MALKIYSSGNMVAHQNTGGETGGKVTPTLKANKVYKWPQNAMFYSYDSEKNVFSVVRFSFHQELTLGYDLVYGDFIKEDNSTFSSNNDLIIYLDSILGSNDHPDFNDANFDAFARQRISNPETLFDSKQIFDSQPLFWDDQEISGSGTSSTYSKPNARTRLAVSASTAGVRTRQTFMRFNYQPGKSQLVIMTAVMSDASSQGISARVGQFDDDNGLFFVAEDVTIKVVLRTSTSGSAVDTKVSQTNWNIDKLDGTGNSGVTLDPTKTQILFIDYEWLGVGRIRFGFFNAGTPIYCHEILNANIGEQVYMSLPNLPIRYELENNGNGGAVSMDHICATVISEGGNQDLGILRYSSNAGASITCAAINTIYAIIGIKLKSTHLAAAVTINRMAIQIQSGTENGEWLWVLNPTVANVFTYADETNSAVQIALGAANNTVTNGTLITGGYAESTSGGQGSGGVTSPIPNALRLGSLIDGTPDEMVLCWRPLVGTNQEIEGSITWRELS